MGKYGLLLEKVARRTKTGLFLSLLEEDAYELEQDILSGKVTGRIHPDERREMKRDVRLINSLIKDIREVCEHQDYDC